MNGLLTITKILQKPLIYKVKKCSSGLTILLLEETGEELLFAIKVSKVYQKWCKKG